MERSETRILYRKEKLNRRQITGFLTPAVKCVLEGRMVRTASVLTSGKLNCHPGPCPPCIVGTKAILCLWQKHQDPLNVENQEGKYSHVKMSVERSLKCKKHMCSKTCHEDDCGPCNEDIILKCNCGKSTKTVKCSTESSAGDKFDCENTCGRKLACGNHTCQEPCHSGPCSECKLSPKVIQSCPCGKKQLSELSKTPRLSCLDEIPFCGSVCEKDLFWWT